MNRFLSEKVIVLTIMGEVHGISRTYKGIMTSFDDEFVCLDEKVYIVKKYILSITIK